MKYSLGVEKIIEPLGGGIRKTISNSVFILSFTKEKSFALTIIVSIIVGQMSGLILNADWRMLLLAGYSGSDFLESMYKLSVTRFLK